MPLLLKINEVDRIDESFPNVFARMFPSIMNTGRKI